MVCNSIVTAISCRFFSAQHKKKERLLISSLSWSGKRGSNSRPQPWQGCALPTELFPHTLSEKERIGEEDETRTHTTQRPLPPQSSASTNSATSPFPTFQSAQHRVPRTGLEPARLSTLAPETSASTIPPPGLLLNTSVHALSDFERKTRLELATPTLARLCSTN